MEDTNKLRREFKRRFHVSLPTDIASQAIERIGLDRSLEILNRIRSDASNPIGYFKRSVENEPVEEEHISLDDEEPFVPEEFEHPYMSRDEFRRWYYEQYPEAQERDDPNPRSYDLQNFSDLTRYRDLFLELRQKILNGDPNIWNTPLLQHIRNLFFDMFPCYVFDNLHPRAKVAVLYGYLCALEERNDELPGDQSIRKEGEPPRDEPDRLDIQGVPSLDDEIPF